MCACVYVCVFISQLQEDAAIHQAAAFRKAKVSAPIATSTRHQYVLMLSFALRYHEEGAEAGEAQDGRGAVERTSGFPPQILDTQKRMQTANEKICIIIVLEPAGGSIPVVAEALTKRLDMRACV